MMKHNVAPSPKMVTQLYDSFSAEAHPHIRMLTSPPEQAPLPGVTGEFVPYVRASQPPGNDTDDVRAKIFVPGFGEGIVNKIPMAVAMAEAGIDIILPGQNRSGLAPEDPGKNAAIQTQTRNILAVAAHAGVLEKFDLVAHSLGGMVAAEVVNQLQEMGYDTSEMTVVTLASAGASQETSYVRLFWRWVKMLKSEFGPDNKEFPDRTGETGRASARNLATNPRQTFAEIRALRHERLDIAALCRKVGRVVFVCYAEDEMYPEDHMYDGLKEAFEQPDVENLVALTPVVYGNPARGEKLGRRPVAVHDDEQLNPRRVVNAIKPFLLRKD